MDYRVSINLEGQTRPAGEAEPVEGLRARHLVHEVQVDVDETVARPADLVGLPDLVEQRPRHGQLLRSPALRTARSTPSSGPGTTLATRAMICPSPMSG